MNAKVTVLSIAAALLFAAPVFAAEMTAEMAAEPVQAEAQAVAETAVVEQAMPAEVVAPVVVGNKVCPVTGAEIPEDQMGQTTVEYNGKVYNLCCPMCKEKFLANPEEMARIAEGAVVAEPVAVMEAETK